MPNLGYNRSTKREREIVREYKIMGWESARSAGSHGKFDVWAWNPKTHEVHLIQVKTKKNARVSSHKKATSVEATVQTWEQHYE